MRRMFLTTSLLLVPISISAQQLPEWYRVYTFDDSLIEMNTSQVIYSSEGMGRIRFRWRFTTPQVVTGSPRLRYKSRLEVFEFDCEAERRYRPYAVLLLDGAGKVIHSERVNRLAEWGRVTPGSMMEKLATPACALIAARLHPRSMSSEDQELKQVAKYAFLFSRSLEQAKDFNPLLPKFFAADYLDGYLHDKSTDWFVNLDPETAAKASRAELQRFYVALMNVGYLTWLHVISQYPSDLDQVDADTTVPEEKLIPPELLRLVKNHHYTTAYKQIEGNYDYLAEKIDSIERLRSYTHLLEAIAAFMRNRVTSLRVERSKKYRAVLEDLDSAFDLYEPKARICANDCLGLAQGTRIIEINVPVFHLQFAEVRGKLKIVSASSYF